MGGWKHNVCVDSRASEVFQSCKTVFFLQVKWCPGVSSLVSPAVSKRRLPCPKVPVFQVALHLLQLVGPEALVDPWRELVAQGRDDVAVTVEAQLLARLKAREKETKVGNNLQRTKEC